MGAVAGSVFPAGEVDADELVSQGAAGLVVFVFVSLALAAVVGTSPGFDLGRTRSILVTQLSDDALA